MADIWVNPYSGQEEESCSVSFGAQQQVFGSTGSQQTEADYNKSKLLGELGVMAGKLSNGQIPNGTKVLAYENTHNGNRGYYYVKGGKLWKRVYKADGTQLIDKETDFANAEIVAKSGLNKASIPQAVAAKPKPEPVLIDAKYAQKVGDDPAIHAKGGKPVAVNLAGDYISYDPETDAFSVYTTDPVTDAKVQGKTSYSFKALMQNEPWYKPDGKNTTAKSEPAKTAPPPTNLPPSSPQVAAPTPTTPVNAGSESVGSMSNEDVSAMFVKIKDDLTKELGLNIKGANADLDAIVHKSIGGKTGYTAAEVKAKIEAYKATGAKLSALKKKVMAGKYKVPEGKASGSAPQPTKASPAAPLNTPKTTSTPVVDPKPNGVPTTATPKLANEVKADVKAKVEAEPSKVFTAEDVAAQYIMRKDEIVAASNGKWTLYTKNDELELDIAIAIGLKTGLNPLQQKEKIAEYLGSGKKLSVLKKQLIKQGAMKPQADTLKKSGTAKTAAETKAEVNAKADAGYTPTPTPATGNPPVDTGKPAPKRVEKEAAEAGDISGVPETTKKLVFEKFKNTGHNSYLSSGSGMNYDGFVKVKADLDLLLSKKYTMLQIVRMVDEYGAAKAGVDNGKLFEKQVIEWLTTPAGAKHIKDNEAKALKDAEDAKKEAEIAKAAKILEASQPPLPADSRRFQEMSPQKALNFQSEMLAKRPFNPGEKQALRTYTGSAYSSMNQYLRGEKKTTTHKQTIEVAKKAFRPAPEDMLLRRGTGRKQFALTDINNIWGITGKTFEDKGFVSTSAAGKAAFGGEIALEIEAPAGAPGMWVDNFSQHKGENEWLLPPGCKFEVLNVRKETSTYGGGTYVVRMRLVEWPK